MNRTSRTAPLLALLILLALLGVTLAVVGVADPAPAAPARHGPERRPVLGPGTPTMPGFSGYVTATGHELGVARLPDGRYGVCLDTGAEFAWPTLTGPDHSRTDPRIGYLTSVHLDRARTDGVVAAALWWAVGRDLGLNSHPGRIAGYVAELRREDPVVYAAVARVHDRMLRRARRFAPPRSGYAAPTVAVIIGDTPLTGSVAGIGLRSATGRWVPDIRVRITLSGARFADGSTSWTGTTRRQEIVLPWRQSEPGRVAVAVRLSDVPNHHYRRYEATPDQQRIAASAGPVGLAARASAVTTGVPLIVTKTAEGGDPAGLVGVTVQLHQGLADGPLVAEHTFTEADLGDGRASYLFPAAFHPARRYTAVVTAEPAGWRPERAVVRASRTPAGFAVELADQRLWQPRITTRISRQAASPGATLVDTVTVTDTGGDSLAGEWHLLGPIAPGPSGCRGLDWSGTPVAAGGPFTIDGDGDYQIGSSVVVAAGCYTYVERLDGNDTTLPTPWTPAGLETETVLVTATPQLATQVSTQRATVGQRIVDQVAVTGLPTGPASGAVSGEWQLLGPIAPGPGLSCDTAAWPGATAAASGTFSVTADGVYPVGAFWPRHGGCYTYIERLLPTPVSAEAPWTPRGVPAETTVVMPSPPRIPGSPHIDTGGEWPTGPELDGRAPAAELRAPGVGLTARLTPIRFNGDALRPPLSLTSGAIWADGADLSELVGTTVVMGHVSDNHDRPGVFKRLHGVHTGDVLTTVAVDGTLTRWRVAGVRSVDREKLPSGIFRQGLARRLVVVTCVDKVTYASGAFHYRKNLIVEATPLP